MTVIETPRIPPTLARRVDKRTPAALSLGIDVSGSTKVSVRGEKLVRHFERAANEAMRSLGSASRDGFTFDSRLHLAVLLFDEEVRSALPYIDGGEIRLIPGAELFPYPSRVDEVDGLELPTFVEPNEPGGRSDLSAFYSTSLKLAQSWGVEYPTAHAATVVCSTDAMWNEGVDPEPICKEIMECGTALGRSTVFNAMVADGPACVFPSSLAELPEDEWAHKLFHCSSELTPEQLRAALVRKPPVKDGSRALLFNGDLASLASFYEFASEGTIAR